MHIGAAYMSERKQVVRANMMGMSPFPALTVYELLNLLESEGEVKVRSSKPEDRPRIAPSFLSAESDHKMAIDVVRFVRRYFEQPAVRDIVDKESEPGGGDSDEETLAAARRKGIAGLHTVSTCAMGSVPGSVVDSRLRVRCIKGLRVVDCTVTPRLLGRQYEWTGDGSCMAGVGPHYRRRAYRHEALQGMG